MNTYWHPWDLIYLSPVVIGWYIALVFYLMSAQTGLTRCAAERRAMAPRRVWLALIPVFGFAWVIVVALALSTSLEGELGAKEIRNVSAPGRAFGVTAGSLFCVATVFLALAIVAGATGLSADPELGDNQVASFGWVMWFLSGAAGLALWVVNWVQVQRVSSRLAQPWTWNSAPRPYPAMYAWPQPPYAGPAAAAGPAVPPAAAPDPLGDFCPACGRRTPATRFCPHCGKERTSA
jgi:hypothetical protein